MFDMERWRRGLNSAQAAAAGHDGPPLLVVAGAGTGKTRTLVARLARLVDAGAPPERVLLLTFTRRAAREMLRRARGLTGEAGIGRVWGGTFHAASNRLLRSHGAALGLPANFTIIDAGDSTDLLDLIRSELGLGAGRRRFPRKDTLQAIYSTVINCGSKLSDVVERSFPWCNDDIDSMRALFEAYTERKRAHLVLDFDDLLLQWRTLTRHPRAGDALRGLFDHILIDEYQDTNALQAEIVAGMYRPGSSLMAVGDDAQAIYSFRAATVANMLDFRRLFPDGQVALLERNYRSSQPILDVSNALLAEARRGYSKELIAERSGRIVPSLVQSVDESEQSDEVCRRVLDARERGVLLRRQAVLFRAGHHSAGLELELARRNIPFVKYGGLRFIDSAHVKDVLAFLRVIENPSDELSLFRVLQLVEGVGPRTARRIMDELGAGNESSVRRLADEPLIVDHADLAALRGLQRTIADLLSSPATPAPQLERILRFYGPVLERVYPDALARRRDVEALTRIATTFSDRAAFLSELTLDPPASTEDLAGKPLLDDDYLVLSTIHSAKGCEWDEVHVIHACDGMIPSDMALSDADGLDEERRVFYVALTRARNRLFVHFPLRYYHRRMSLEDGHGYGQLTRFITDGVKPCFAVHACEPEERPARWNDDLTELWR